MTNSNTAAKNTALTTAQKNDIILNAPRIIAEADVLHTKSYVAMGVSMAAYIAITEQALSIKECAILRAPEAQAEIMALDSRAARDGSSAFQAGKKWRQRYVNPLFASREFWVHQVDFSKIDFTSLDTVAETAINTFDWLTETDSLTSIVAFFKDFTPNEDPKPELTKGKEKGNASNTAQTEANEAAGKDVIKAVNDAVESIEDAVLSIHAKYEKQILNAKKADQQALLATAFNEVAEMVKARAL